MATIFATIAGVLMAVIVYSIRLRAATKPSSVKKIILPPIFMSTGGLMFLFPEFHVAPLQVIEALLVGFIFSLLLIKTSTFEVKENDIYLKRSKAFLFILIGLLVIRIIAKLIFSAHFNVGELAGMFWLLAFGMIVPWRVAMLIKYNVLKNTLNRSSFN